MEAGFKRLSHFLSSGNLIAKGEGSPLGSKGHLAWIGLTHQQPAASSHPLLPFRLKDGAVAMHQKQWEWWLENGKPQTKLRSKKSRKEGTDIWIKYTSNQMVPRDPGFLLVTCFIPGWDSSSHGYFHCSGLVKWSWSITAFWSIFAWHLRKTWCCSPFSSGLPVRWSGLCTFYPILDMQWFCRFHCCNVSSLKVTSNHSYTVHHWWLPNSPSEVICEHCAWVWDLLQYLGMSQKWLWVPPMFTE